jgi:hypothetical protein
MKLAAIMVSLAALALGDDRPIYFQAENDPGKAIKGTDLRMSRPEWGWAEMLVQLQEPPLCCAVEKAVETYRFTWLRTFHHPVVVSLSRLDERNWRVMVKIGTGKSGFDFGNTKVQSEKSRIVPEEQLNLLLRMFGSDAEFWGLPSTNDESGSDGAIWLIEARREGAHYYAGRWSPESGIVREIGLRFLEISGLELEPDSIY